MPVDLEEEGGVGVADMSDPVANHNCHELMIAETKGLPNVTETPLTNPDAEYFVDGSRWWNDEQGHFVTGYAVIQDGKVIIQKPLPSCASAQEAELKALTDACTMGKGLRINCYTDSRYAFGVAHDFGVIWKTRGFLTSSGKPIKNSEAVQSLIEALELPTEVAIVKVPAHVKQDDPLAVGNAQADQAAKQAAGLPLLT